MSRWPKTALVAVVLLGGCGSDAGVTGAGSPPPLTSAAPSADQMTTLWRLLSPTATACPVATANDLHALLAIIDPTPTTTQPCTPSEAAP